MTEEQERLKVKLEPPGVPKPKQNVFQKYSHQILLGLAAGGGVLLGLLLGGKGFGARGLSEEPEDE